MVRFGFIALLTLPLLTACTSSLIDLREDLDVHRSSYKEKLAGNPATTEKFLACTQQAHDESSLPLTIATTSSSTGSPVSSTAVSGRLRVPVQTLVEQIHD